jgi:hypothetical protein
VGENSETLMISVSQKLGIVSVPTIGILAAMFGLFGLAEGIEWQSVVVETILNIGVILSVSLVVARISAKSFLSTGSPNILLLGLAVFEFGFSATLGGFISGININEGLEMYVLGALVSACLHLASAILTYRGSPVRRTRLGLRLWFSYSATVVFVLLLAVLVLNLSFLSPIAQLGSFSERVFIGSIVALLLASAFFFSRVYFRSHSPILYWYSLALATTSFAYFAFFATQDNGDLATWTGIGSLCLASVYFLKSVLAAPKNTASAIGTAQKSDKGNHI